MKKERKGFTLIELLICILIIGVLAGVAIPQYRYSVAKSKFSQLKIAAKAIREGQRRYMLANNKQWTFDLTALDINIEGCTYGPGSYSSSDKTDRINCDWGMCQLTYDLARSMIVCGLNNPKVNYFLYFNSELKYCCSNKGSDLGKRLCQEEFPKVTPRDGGDTCGVGGFLFSGY